MQADPRLRRGDATFENVSVAARMLGVTPANIHWHLRRHGHLDRVGAGARTNANHYCWQGEIYSGQAAVAAAAGKSVATVQHHLKAYGSLDLLAGPGERTRNSYLWRGKIYYGQAAVADAAGVSLNTVGLHLKRNGNLNQLGQRSHSARRAVMVDHHNWPSISAFAKAVGRSHARTSVVVRAGNIDLMRKWIEDAGLARPDPEPIAPPAASPADLAEYAPALMPGEIRFGTVTARQGNTGEVHLVRSGLVGRRRAASAMLWCKSQVQAALDSAAMRGSQDEVRALRWAMERVTDG